MDWLGNSVVVCICSTISKHILPLNRHDLKKSGNFLFEVYSCDVTIGEVMRILDDVISSSEKS